MNQPQTPDNEVVDLSPPKEWLYKCDCPQCRVGAHYNKDIADSYRKRGELNNEVARLQQENVMLRELLIQTSLTKLATSLDSASKVTHKGNADATDKQQVNATEQCDHAEHAEPLTGSYRCRKCDKIFDIVEPKNDEWCLVGVGEKMKSGDEAFHYGAWVLVEKLNWVGETLSNPHTLVRRRIAPAPEEPHNPTK